MSININNDYSLKFYEANKSERIERVGIAATATFTFTSKPNEESHISLTDHTGTTKIFEIDNDNDGAGVGKIAVNGIAAAGGGATGTAADLVAKINAQSGFKITATNPSDGVVLLTQDSVGPDGNTAISVDNGVHWDTTTSVNIPSNFSGGSDTRIAIVAPFRIAVNGAPNLRLQSNQKRYETFIGEQKL